MEVVDVIRVVELTQLLFSGSFSVKNAHGLRQMKILNEAVCHFDAFGFHRMVLAEDVLGDLFVINVGHWLHVHFPYNIYITQYNQFVFILRFLSMSINNNEHGIKSVDTIYNYLPIYFVSFYGVVFGVFDVQVFA